MHVGYFGFVVVSLATGGVRVVSPGGFVEMVSSARRSIACHTACARVGFLANCTAALSS